jgi:hypothetical protein
LLELVKRFTERIAVISQKATDNPPFEVSSSDTSTIPLIAWLTMITG